MLGTVQSRSDDSTMPNCKEDLLSPFHGYGFSGYTCLRVATRSYMLSALRAWGILVRVKISIPY